ncbi:hypothetical protein D3C85_1535870 [compost metagenome]
MQEFSYCEFDLFDNPFRFTVIHLTGSPYQARLLRGFAHNEPRVNGNAMAAHTRARLKNIDSRVTVCKSDQFPNTDIKFVANH